MNKNIFDIPGFINGCLSTSTSVDLYQDYLEIGVSLGDTFKRVRAKNKIGVDINRDFIATHYMSSNDFFVLAEQKNMMFDFIFIDGDHSHKQVVKDFNNSLRFIKDTGIIMVHDMIPPDEDHNSPKGCGDGYKMLATAIDEKVTSMISISPIELTLGTTIFYNPKNIGSISESNNYLEWGAFMRSYIKDIRFFSHNDAISFIKNVR